ncbi:hypothetical protein EW146_g1180 [Bondarzewia mesenterica]|uniref:Uncharacterized protein n=1 Tax=Bondarzewia mesenterica TaxID=1095465 RepID=A0A4S4M6F9_9AGAM|nr:hypothetical protein EW146_g1180 [Bondarzewia mesenterica]
MSLVALGIRTAYLLDAFSVPDPVDVFSRVIIQLPSEIPLFESVLHVYEPSSEQSFLINVPLFRRACQGGEGFAPDQAENTSFISLNETPTRLSKAPDDLRRVLNGLSESFAATSDPSIPLPTGLTQQTVIPLAAVLLEYPVAYVPISAYQTDFLSSIPLTVYECTLRFNGRDAATGSNSHCILKFSCPTMIEDQFHFLSPSELTPKLAEHFRRRIVEADLSASVQVKYHVETHDRVAL